MENPRDAQASVVVEVAREGNLLLTVGPEETILRVHSTLLMAASKPFYVMLGPNWKEGHDVRNHDEPAELSLPEDNAAALRLICFVIHHQNTDMPQSLTAEDVLAVAVAAEKYDCASALRSASGSWLKTSRSEPGDLVFLATAAYLFQNGQTFKQITRTLKLDYDGPYLDLFQVKVESLMTWKVSCSIVIFV
ncbi:hypothetical protein FSARC_2962 [Fusarium sarcochroum]|uniref:BTB domain-containing protein n=1 Tax=Fusarium sarcochroum TaxID=1208366 RepID=A0A8H4XD19_9HYPO|nr:hypothetical protein FSARC_2962 [Fusarium sarcochroum]